MVETLTPPELRDVAAAYRIALADLRDWHVCTRSFGPTSPVTLAARDCYYRSEAAWRETHRRYEEGGLP